MALWEDQLAYTVKQLAREELGDIRQVLFGNIANYYADMHAVEVILPSERDTLGNAMQTGPIALGAGLAGNGYGIQAAPAGGASSSNPAGGEPCIVLILDRVYGLFVCAFMYWNEVFSPPIKSLAGGSIAIVPKGGGHVSVGATGPGGTEPIDAMVLGTTYLNAESIAMTALGAALTKLASDPLFFSMFPISVAAIAAAGVAVTSFATADPTYASTSAKVGT